MDQISKYHGFQISNRPLLVFTAGCRCRSLPDHVKALWVITKKEQTASVVKDAMDKGIQHIWIQQKSESPEAIALANKGGINLISKQCMLMHFDAHGIHKFHRGIKKFFGTLPA